MICPENGNKDWDDLLCRDCQWYMQCFKMWQDGNIWGKEKATGDNFPKIKHDPPKMDKIRELNNQEQEIKNSINIIGENSTFEMIEAIADYKMRLRYRLIFLKLGGKIPERDINAD
jgi:hypothetical protein